MKTFSIYNDPGKTTSGQRFWSELSNELARRPGFRPNTQTADALYLNISAPWSKIWTAIKSRRRIILRVDGIYHERVSKAAISAMERPASRWFMKILWTVMGPSQWSSWLMNLLRHNFKLLVKVYPADLIVYQSAFSQSLWKRYFPSAKSSVVLNGAPFIGRPKLPDLSGPLRVMTTYDSWRPSKRLHDLIAFVRTHNAQVRPHTPLELLILGYSESKTPATLTEEDRAWINAGVGIKTIPPFRNYTPEIVAAVQSQHLYLTFTFRDNCPNAVIEAMSYGLPVVAVGSGGVPEIVGDAGEIVPMLQDSPYFSPFDHSFDFPAIDFAEVSRRIEWVASDYLSYCTRVRRRFDNELSLEKTADRYLALLQEL